MNSNNKFKAFLESMSGYDYKLIKTIKSAYNMIYESTGNPKSTKTDYKLNDYYQIDSVDPELIKTVLEYTPEILPLLQQKNISLDSIHNINVYIGLDDVNGEGYNRGTRGSWDEQPEGSYFDDIIVDINGITVTIGTGDDEIQLETSNESNPNLYEWANSIIAEDEDVHNDLINNYEEDMDDDRSDYEADERESRWERDLDRY